MVGILCFYTPSGEISILGILIAIASGAANAFYTVFVSASGLLLLPTFKLAGWLNAISILPVVLVAPAMGGLVLSTSISGWEALFLLCTLSGTASIAYMLGTKFVGPQSISLLSTFEPLTSVVLGTIVPHETITRQSGWGIVCILLAVCLVSTTKDPWAPPNTNTETTTLSGWIKEKCFSRLFLWKADVCSKIFGTSFHAHGWAYTHASETFGRCLARLHICRL